MGIRKINAEMPQTNELASSNLEPTTAQAKHIRFRIEKGKNVAERTYMKVG